MASHRERIGLVAVLVLVATSLAAALWLVQPEQAERVARLRLRVLNRMVVESELGRVPGLNLCHSPTGDGSVDVVDLQPAFGGRAFTRPVDIAQHPANPRRWYVAQHNGLILQIRDDGQISTLADLRGLVAHGEQWGLQSIALHPDFVEDGRMFLGYTSHDQRDAPQGLASHLAVLDTLAGSRSAVEASLRQLLSESQRRPYHPIANLRFGPDGMLYVSWGGGASQDGLSLRGKLLRLAVSKGGSETKVSAAADNPFVGDVVRPEVYALGFRNPWRFSFDRVTGDLWLGDVGRSSYEEVNRIERGGHYGWPLFEGTSCRSPECSSIDHRPPVVQHRGAELCSLTGGVLYRGDELEGLQGHYIYGDHCSGSLWAFDPSAPSPEPRVIRSGNGEVLPGSFAEGSDGELFVVQTSGHGTGQDRVFRLVSRAAPDPAPQARARSLRELGCVQSGSYANTPLGMLNYQLVAPAWNDGAEVLRFMTPSIDDFIGPWDTVRARPHALFLKTFARGGRPIETQMLAKRPDGTWRAYTFAWNEQGTDAVPVEAVQRRVLDSGEAWFFQPDGCFRCHSSATDVLIGATRAQLELPVPETGSNQLADWLADGTIAPEDAARNGSYPTEWPGSDAASYLHVNCAHCHQPGGAAADSGLDLRISALHEGRGFCDPPGSSMPGSMATQPGSASSTPQSQGPLAGAILQRMASVGPDAMPPGRGPVDVDGLALVGAWLDRLEPCAAAR